MNEAVQPSAQLVRMRRHLFVFQILSNRPVWWPGGSTIKFTRVRGDITNATRTAINTDGTRVTGYGSEK